MAEKLQELENLKLKHDEDLERMKAVLDSEVRAEIVKMRKELKSLKEKEEKKVQKKYEMKLKEDMIYLRQQSEDTSEKKEAYFKELRGKSSLMT